MVTYSDKNLGAQCNGKGGITEPLAFRATQVIMAA